MAHVKSIKVVKSNTDDIKRQVRSIIVVAGVPKGSNPYPDGTPVAEVAHDHEFGSPMPRTYTSKRGNKVSVSGIPERSFLRTTAKEQMPKYKKLALEAVKRAIKGSSTGSEAAQIGAQMTVDIQAKITSIDTPPNSPQVIADKYGASNPLIDTGHLLNSITHKVRLNK